MFLILEFATSYNHTVVVVFDLRTLVPIRVVLAMYYSIVKDSNADLGVIFRFLQNFPITKAVCTKISKFFFCIFGKILIFLRENKEASFFIF